MNEWKRRKRVRKVLTWIAVLAILAFFGIYIVLPVGVGLAAIFPDRVPVGDPPDGFETISLQTEDDVTLAAWYTPPSNGAAIILLHGAGNSREEMRTYAEMLVRHGYGVLALDQRGHGESGGATNRLGWQGTRDIKAAVKYLQALGEVKKIGGLGLSMGGEVLLGAASECPEISAIVADGATRRSLAEMLVLQFQRPLYRNLAARVLFTAVRIGTRENPPKPLLDSMRETSATRFLLIAGGGNELEVDYNELYARTMGRRAELWVAPDAPHTGAFSLYPQEYEQRVTGFFDSALLDGISDISQD